MKSSALVISIGAICFGVVLGYVTYRTLVRKAEAVITDIAGVAGAVGGGAVSVWFDRHGGDSFAYYSIGLLLGMLLYYLQFLLTHTQEEAKQLLTAQVEIGDSLPVPHTRTPNELEDIERRTGASSPAD